MIVNDFYSLLHTLLRFYYCLYFCLRMLSKPHHRISLTDSVTMNCLSVMNFVIVIIKSNLISKMLQSSGSQIFEQYTPNVSQEDSADSFPICLAQPVDLMSPRTTAIMNDLKCYSLRWIDKKHSYKETTVETGLF